ncbi:MAG: DegT/DnrJ/EryC1/StrS family aminotransferase [Proteobacteria bacterium]|nr:DegT/DnrJ/EryC1/StrS family aminotransferase [Pseudomonadota bacterium]
MSREVPLIDLSRMEPIVAKTVAAAIERVRHSGRYLLGSELATFEAAFAAWCGTDHCVGVANGTDALELALRALDCGSGDVVATVANAGIYATVAILAVGATPLYVDIDADCMTMSAAALEAAMSPAVKVVIATHLYGRLADLDALAAAAPGVALIEDCAQAHGAMRDHVRAGAFGAIGCFSFYPTKNLGAMGDAGALTTDDPDLAATLRALRSYGWSKRFVATRSGGRNSRLDEMQAAVLSAKLPYVEGWNARRREIAAIYEQTLSGLNLQLPNTGTVSHVVHLYVVRAGNRDDLAARLRAAGIGCEVHYPVPDYRQPAVVAALGALAPLAETERAVAEVLTLPCHPWMSDDEVTQVATAVRASLNANEG